MWRVVRIAVIGVVVAVLILFAALMLRVPMPPNVGVAEATDRTVRGALAEFETRLLGGSLRLRGARELVALDEGLHSIGRRGILILLEYSPDEAERQQLIGRVFSGKSESLRVDSLLAILHRITPQGLSLAAEFAPQVQDESDRQAIWKAVASRGLALGADGLATAVTAAASLTGEGNLKADVAHEIVRQRRVDVLDAVVDLAPAMPPERRHDLSLAMSEEEFIKMTGLSRSRTSLLALKIARNATTLNNRALELPRPEEALDMLAEARRLDPESVIIGANYANVAKRLALSRRDRTADLEALDRLLQAGLESRPGVESWREARQMALPALVPPSRCSP